MHPGQRKSFPEGGWVIRQAGAASHVEGSHHGVWLTIKAGMWQAGTHLDLSVELFMKCHMAFGCTHLETELPLGFMELASPGFLLSSQSFDSSRRTVYRVCTDQAQNECMGGRHCTAVCIVHLCKGYGSSKEKTTNSAWRFQEWHPEEGIFGPEGLDEHRDAFEIRQIRRKINPVQRKQSVQGLAVFSSAEKEAEVAKWGNHT